MIGPADRARAALALADWLERVRAAGGYGGPVAHWWRDCLVDCRPGYDWRYEGIVDAYLALHRTTGDGLWLPRARRAGDDLIAAQTDDGHFLRSRFELNPGTGGTPHEAAASTGLLRLALALRPTDPAAAECYLAAARRNLELGQVARLWDAEARSFRDDPRQPSFVPNKASTLIEALVLLAEATGTDRYIHEHVLPTAEAVVRHQVRCPGSRLDGAIAQNSFGSRLVEKYFPYYVARCVPGLLAAHRFARDDRFADAALAAGRFVARWRDGDGAFPQVVYEDGQANRYPRWVAAVGDVLRALDLLHPFGFSWDPAPTEAWLLSGLLPNGGVMTARGFAGQGSGTPPNGLPEFRDLLSVAGWADKAFRYLAGRIEPGPANDGDPPPPRTFETECVFLGRSLTFVGRTDGLELRERRRVVYRWCTGESWADAEPWMTMR